MNPRPVLALAAAALTVLAFDAWRPPRWHASLEAAREAARGGLLLCQFEPVGRPLTEVVRATLEQPDVVRAVKRDFACARLDSTRHAQLFDAWVGGGPGLATCVLDAQGELVAVHRGSATPDQMLAFLELARENARRAAEARAAPLPR